MQAHKELGEVLFTLRQVLGHYPALHTTDVLPAAAVLITKVKRRSTFSAKHSMNKIPIFKDSSRLWGSVDLPYVYCWSVLEFRHVRIVSITIFVLWRCKLWRCRQWAEGGDIQYRPASHCFWNQVSLEAILILTFLFLGNVYFLISTISRSPEIEILKYMKCTCFYKFILILFLVFLNISWEM